MATPKLDQFIQEIGQILKAKEGDRLRDYLIIEPPLPPLYEVLVQELRSAFPASGPPERLERKCENGIPEYEDMGSTGGSWPAFNAFLVNYFVFMRDVNAEQLVETHEMIKSLLSQCVLALSDSTMGLTVLPTTIRLAETLARLSIGLEKHPELLHSLLTSRRASTARGSESLMERVTLVESSANTIREAFSKCLSERFTPNTVSTLTKPSLYSQANGISPSQGRRVGIYILSNLCLKLFFHARILRSAEQLFTNIYAQSPPLEAFPAAQRVKHLYYLGRYHLANSHFSRGARCLEAAYTQCHRDALRQRRLILRPLVTANVILGRFPSAKLLNRPEAAGFTEIFAPICLAMRRGDFRSFRAALETGTPAASWLLQIRLLLQMRNRGEVIVWRSLFRRCFLLKGWKGEAGNRQAPNMELGVVRRAYKWLEWDKAQWVDPDLRRWGANYGDKEDERIIWQHLKEEYRDDQEIVQCADEMIQQLDQKPSAFVPNLGGQAPSYQIKSFGQGSANQSTPSTAEVESSTDSEDEVHPDNRDSSVSSKFEAPPKGMDEPQFDEIAMMAASLISQGLMRGYISHKFQKFVVLGAKQHAKAIDAGWPVVWSVLKAKIEASEAAMEVPGWVTQEVVQKRRSGGQVVRMKGARAVGAG